MGADDVPTLAITRRSRRCCYFLKNAAGNPAVEERIDLCPRFCRLHEGQRAFCFVRARQGDQIVLTTYGRSSGFCVDPVEKKALNHFLPGYAGAVVRDQRLQSGLQVLPELGHQQGARI